jgi:hypothetical protein
MALTFEQGAALGGSLGQLGGYVGDKMGWTGKAQAQARNDKLFGAPHVPTWGEQISSGIGRLSDLATNTSTGESFTGSNSGGLSTAVNAPVAVPTPTSAYPAGAPAAKPAGFDDAFAPANGFRPAPGGASTAPASISPTAPAAAPAAPQADTGAFGANISTADLIAVLRDEDSSDADKKIAASVLAPRMSPNDQTAILPEGGALIDKRTGKVIAQGDPKQNDMQRNFELSQKDARFAQFLKDNKAGTNVNVNAGEKKFDQTFGEEYAKKFVELQKDATSGQNVLNTFDAMKGLLKDPNFQSGSGAGYKLALDKAIVALGGDPKLTASREAFNSLASKSVLDSLGGKLGAGVSNTDVSFIQGIAPALDNTPQGIALLVNIQSRMAKRQKELAKLAREYKREKGVFDDGFDQVAADYAEAHPLFADLSVPTAAPPPATPPVQIDGFTITPG